MGGAACKEAIDGNNSNGMAAQFKVTVHSYTTVLPHLDEYINAAERRAGKSLGKKIEKALVAIGKFADRIRAFYAPLVDKYSVTVEPFQWSDDENPIVRFQQHLEAIDAVIFDLSPQFTEAEQAKALKLSYDECDFAEKIRAVNDEVQTWLTETAEKYDGD